MLSKEEIEESIKILNKFNSIKILYGNTFAMLLEDVEQLQQAIEIALNYIENSISKEVIKRKLKQEELPSLNFCARKNGKTFIYFKKIGKIEAYKELLEGK